MSALESARDRLDSWKEIAEYVGRDVRTAIRWERDRGLPVHRVPGGRRGAVFASRTEIDAWLRGSPPHAAVGRPPLAPAFSAGQTDPTGGMARPRVLGAGIVATVGGLLIVTLIAAGVLRACRSDEQGRLSASQVARLDYSPREIVARAEDGAVRWRFRPPAAIETSLLDQATAPWYDIKDLDGDGRSETVATLPLRPSDPMPGHALSTDHLFCLSIDGKVLWQTTLEDRLRFRSGSFGPPWVGGRVAAFRAKSGWRVAWSLTHHTWWPSPLVIFDASGRRVSTFVHAGAIRAVRAFEVEGHSFILAGGVANAHRAAFLAVLDADAVRGHGPVPAGSPFECVACEDELPRGYFVFPPSDINEATGLPYNQVGRIISYPSVIEAFTLESQGSPSPIAEMVFRFSPTFELLDARSSDSFPAHEFYERAGKLDHPAARCPWYLKPPPVREWTSDGWRDLTPSDGEERSSR